MTLKNSNGMTYTETRHGNMVSGRFYDVTGECVVSYEMSDNGNLPMWDHVWEEGWE